ncbi:MAG: vitamin K epoxide reductase family protein [Pelobacteraceae bacterium]
MLQMSDRQGAPFGMRYRRAMSILLWLAVSTGLAVSLFTLVEELCLATACSDAASFTFFGFGLGWLGIVYFGFILLLLWLRQKYFLLNWVVAAMVFAGVGSEFRLLWIQKYIIGGWCPLCVSICCALFIAAILLLIEKVQEAGSGADRGKDLLVLLAFVATMIAVGLATAVVGVKALT